MKIKILGLLSLMFLTACSQVDTGHRGVLVTFGKVSNEVLSEGLQWHMPIVTSLKQISIKNNSQKISLECYTEEKQPINFEVTVRYRIPAESARKILTEYQGDIYASLIEPQAKESMMGVVSIIKTEDVIKKRTEIKAKTLAILKEKVGSLVVIEDFIIDNDQLPKELEKAVSEKMVQEQKSLKTKFIKDEEITKNEIMILNAKAQANANSIVSASLTKELIQYEFVKKSDGKLPLVMGSGVNPIIDINSLSNKNK